MCDSWKQGQHVVYWQLTFKKLTVMCVVAHHAVYCFASNWLTTQEVSIESVNKSKSCPVFWHCIWEDLISKREHLSATQWVSFSMDQWFLTELICYIAQYVSVLSLHREEEVENRFKQHIIYAKLSSEHRFRPINVLGWHRVGGAG